jgi:hypothetical protein
VNSVFEDHVPRTWKKTVNLGKGIRTVADFRAAIKHSGLEVFGWGCRVLSDDTALLGLDESENLRLVIVSAVELGFKEDSILSGLIYKRAKDLGLTSCFSDTCFFDDGQINCSAKHGACIIITDSTVDQDRHSLGVRVSYEMNTLYLRVDEDLSFSQMDRIVFLENW